jgi:hypothetical protein
VAERRPDRPNARVFVPDVRRCPSLHKRRWEVIDVPAPFSCPLRLAWTSLRQR